MTPPSLLSADSRFNVQATSEDDSVDPIEEEKAFVFLSSLLQLFAICRVANCGSCVEPCNMRVSNKGAMVIVKTLCNNNHEMSWESSPCVGVGTQRVAVINVLISSYCLLTGLHLKQVYSKSSRR